MPSIQEVFYEPDGQIIYVEAGCVTCTKQMRRKAHYPLERHYYRYVVDANHPEGRRTLTHLKGAECPPLPSP